MDQERDSCPTQPTRGGNPVSATTTPFVFSNKTAIAPLPRLNPGRFGACSPGFYGEQTAFRQSGLYDGRRPPSVIPPNLQGAARRFAAVATRCTGSASWFSPPFTRRHVGKSSSRPPGQWPCEVAPLQVSGEHGSPEATVPVQQPCIDPKRGYCQPAQEGRSAGCRPKTKRHARFRAERTTAGLVKPAPSPLGKLRSLSSLSRQQRLIPSRKRDGACRSVYQVGLVQGRDGSVSKPGHGQACCCQRGASRLLRG